MIRERLSKLQKWILKTLYTNIEPEFPNGGLLRQRIVSDYFQKKTPSVEVVTTRSIQSLIKSGYIEGFTPGKLEDIASIYGLKGKSFEEFRKDYGELVGKPKEKVILPAIEGVNKIKFIMLTDKGKGKAKTLLSEC